jgi:GAF domain-containing protein
MSDTSAHPFIPLHCFVQHAFASPTARSQRQMIANLTAACATAHTAADVGTILLDRACALLAAPAAALVRRDPLHSDSIISLAHGAWVVRCGVRLPAGMGLCGRVIDTQRVHICHPARCMAWCEWPWLIEDIDSIVGLPLLYKQQMLGVLVVGNHNEITSSALSLLTVIAHLAASACATLPWSEPDAHTT